MGNFWKKLLAAVLVLGMMLSGVSALAAEAEAIPLLNDEARFFYSTELSNQNYYSGLYRQAVNVKVGEEQVVRELALYLPEGLRRNEYFVTIALPGDVDAFEYLQTSGWMDIADATRAGIRVLVPGEGGWGTYEEELGYITAARSGGGNSFGGFWYMTGGADYIFGVGDGGALLEQWAAQNPNNVSSQVYVDVDVASDTLAVLSADISFGDNLAMPAHPESRVAAVFTNVKATEIPVPTWLIASDASADYWKAVNVCKEEAEEVSAGFAARAFLQDKDAAFLVATSYSDVVSQVRISEAASYTDPAVIADAYKFLTSYVRSSTDSIHSSVLLDRMDYNEMIEAGRLFEVFDFVQTVDNSKTEGASTATTDWMRNYIVYIPEQCMDYAETQYPVVYFLSGGSTPSHIYMDTTDAWQIADKYGFIAVAPSSVNGWNLQDGSWPPTVDSVTGSVSDDIDFIGKLFTRIEEDFNVDPGRVYITGLSMGGIFCNYLGMQLGDRITAIGSTSGPIFDAEIYNEEYSKGTGYMYLEGATTNILPTMHIFGERDNWPIKIGVWTDEDYDTWYAGQMNTNNANRFSDVYYSYATQKYWVDRNGLDFDSYVFTEEGLTAGGQAVTPVEYTAENVANRYTTAVWYNEQNIPLFAWTACAGRAHSTAVSDYEKVWTDWMSHFTMDENGVRYYDGTAIEG